MAKVPITPEVLAWAIDESGYDAAEVAEQLEAPIDDWLEGRDQPTVTQFHKLATFLKRPEAVFFLPRPPRTHHVEAEFRGMKKRDPSPIERLHMRAAARLQRGLEWVSTELEMKPPEIPRVSITRSPEEVAAEARNRIGVTVAEQLAWSSAFEASRQWRAALERQGVVVLFLPMGKEAVEGFSLWNDLVPLIAVNTHWVAQARCFTMFHEWAHLLTRTNSLCAKSTMATTAEVDKVERWCEEFSAAFLLPARAVEQQLTQRYNWRRGETVGFDQARHIANKFHVSLPASVLRLINRGAAEWGLFKAIPKHADDKPKGGPPAEEGTNTRPDRRLREYGARATQTFLRGVERDVITRDDAIRYLDVADADLEKLRTLTSATG
jgi:Zn-dependent peptidase ImmA (M78 family)